MFVLKTQSIKSVNRVFSLSLHSSTWDFVITIMIASILSRIELALQISLKKGWSVLLD